jgi:asparagine synthase (glutamine-hydrolysing)
MDEREHAQAVAAHLGVSLIEADVSDCWSLSSDWLPDAAFDQPSVPMQAPMMIKLARVAHEAGSNVLLDGVGGDEFLSGSESYIASLLLAGRPMSSYRESRDWAREIDMRPAAVFARAGLLQMTPISLRHRFRALRGRPSPQSTPPWIDLFSLKAVGLESAIPNRDKPPAWQRNRANAAFWEFHTGYALPILGWRERFADAEGVEIRSPYWDLRVIELLARMPDWVHRSAGRSKALLRAAMRPRLPAQVVDRQDKGIFDELMDRGVLEIETRRVEESLRGPLTSLLYLKPDALQTALDQYRDKRHHWWHPLWQAITAGLWLSGEAAAGAKERPVDAGISQRVPAEVGVPRSRS